MKPWTTKTDGEDAQAVMSNACLGLGQETGCEVAPVGEEWWKYRREHPEILNPLSVRRENRAQGVSLWYNKRDWSEV